MKLINGKLKFDVSEVLFIDTERKALPFPKASECKVKTANSWMAFIGLMDAGNGKVELKTKELRDYYNPIKVIIIDSFTRATYLLSKHLKDNGVTGYDFWRDYADELENLMMKWESNGRFIIYTSLDDVIRDSDNISRKVIKVEGKKLEGLVESFFTITLFTSFNPMKSSGEAYQFCTNTDGKNSAKSPLGMFESRLIPNDMSLVLGRIYEYYNMANNPAFENSPMIIVGQSGSGKSTSTSFLFED